MPKHSLDVLIWLEVLVGVYAWLFTELCKEEQVHINCQEAANLAYNYRNLGSLKGEGEGKIAKKIENHEL